MRVQPLSELVEDNQHFPVGPGNSAATERGHGLHQARLFGQLGQRRCAARGGARRGFGRGVQADVDDMPGQSRQDRRLDQRRLAAALRTVQHSRGIAILDILEAGDFQNLTVSGSPPRLRGPGEQVQEETAIFRADQRVPRDHGHGDRVRGWGGRDASAAVAVAPPARSPVWRSDSPCSQSRRSLARSRACTSVCHGRLLRHFKQIRSNSSGIEGSMSLGRRGSDD